MNLRLRRTAVLVAAAATAAGLIYPVGAQQAKGPQCRIIGRATTGSTPLPGVSIVALSGETVAAATSTDSDGTYQLGVGPGTYRLKADLTGFSAVEQDLTLGGERCGQSVSLQLSLAARAPRPAAAAPQPSAGRGRFETLNVQTQQSGTVAEATTPERETLDAAARQLLPPGFSTEAPTESLAVAGNMTNIDRGMMGDRMEAIMRGEFDPATGQFGQGFGPGGRGGPAVKGAPVDAGRDREGAAAREARADRARVATS